MNSSEDLLGSRQSREMLYRSHPFFRWLYFMLVFVGKEKD